jgi:hypothetical protein
MNQQRVYGLISDNGDGSSSMHWFRTPEKVEEMNNHENYWANEGGPAETLTLPADLDLGAAGFRFYHD